MKESSAMFLAFLGLILTAAGAGGVEHSMDTETLLQSLAASIVGLSIMAAGVLGLTHEQS